MNPFKSVDCSIRYDNARIISWTMHPGVSFPEGCTVRIEGSRSGGEWEVLAEGLEDSCCWVDGRKRNYNKRLDECYRLRLVIPDKNEEYVSAIVDAGNYRAYPYSAEAENVLSQATQQIEHSGCKGKLLKRKVFGPRCPDCTDFLGQSTVNEHCERCCGTGIDGGYYPGIELTIIKDSLNTQEARTAMGYAQSESVQGRCIAWPFIRKDDVWVEDGTNKRYVIDQVSPAASYKTTVLVYTLSMHMAEYSDVLYSDTANQRVLDTGSWGSENIKPAKHDASLSSDENDPWDSILANP